ncbi:membrane protein [Pelistega indica]|uniref:Probable lipid II flippase MurJ n=1 Tax=Pelistega indica TaxID=1414851 RepID=V8FWH7_9BURK|nr:MULTISPECIES: murein biosynthesis integral membrane protein MurJ [Pelistega]ETD68236.1 membrane protein [Pelistega indica]
MSLLRSAASISGLTLLSRITGLIRDILIARAFGASPLTDAFWVAFRIPNLLRRLFAEGAFSQAFVPILGEKKATQSEQSVKTLLDHVAMVLFFALLVVTIIGIIGAPLVVWAMASGMKTDGASSGYQEAITMTRIMFPYILCMSLVAFASGVLNTWKKFAVPAFTPVLLNLSMIFASLFLAQFFNTPIYALAVGVMLGGIAQLAVQWGALAKIGLLPSFRHKLSEAWKNPDVRRIIKLMGPAILGVSVAQISILINTNIATWLPAGSVTWLSFADRLMEFPTALLGIAIGTVLLPSLAAANAKGDVADYSHLLDWGLRLVFLLGLPCVLGLGLLSEGLVASLFNYGAFNHHDVLMTKSAVIAYAVGLIGILSVKILAPGFYAKQDIRTPVKIAIFVLICTQLMNLVFVPLFAHAGLALSVGLGSTLNALCLYIGLRCSKTYLPHIQWLSFILRVLPALVLLAAWLIFIQHYINWSMQDATSINQLLSTQLSTWLGDGRWVHSISRILVLLVVLIGSAIVYFGGLFITGFRLRDFARQRA